MNMQSWDRLNSFVDWFIGGDAAPGSNEHRRLRMFLISHLCGPLLGHPIRLFLWLADPHPWPHVYVLGVSIRRSGRSRSWSKCFPRHYTTLAMLSVQNLIFAILVGHLSLRRGQFAVPDVAAGTAAAGLLLSGLEHDAPRLVVFAQITLGLARIYRVYLWDRQFPLHIPIENMVGIGIISAIRRLDLRAS